MKIYSTESFVGGWWLGNFEPSVFKTDQFEVCYKTHAAGEKWDAHYHALGTEFNYLIRGEMCINDMEFEAPVVFVIEPGEVADPTFITDVELIIVKIPSVPGDKYIVDDK